LLIDGGHDPGASHIPFSDSTDSTPENVLLTVVLVLLTEKPIT
jgi:hypothetical protein